MSTKTVLAVSRCHTGTLCSSRHYSGCTLCRCACHIGILSHSLLLHGAALALFVTIAIALTVLFVVARATLALRLTLCFFAAPRRRFGLPLSQQPLLLLYHLTCTLCFVPRHIGTLCRNNHFSGCTLCRACVLSLCMHDEVLYVFDQQHCRTILAANGTFLLVLRNYPLIFVGSHACLIIFEFV